MAQPRREGNLRAAAESERRWRAADDVNSGKAERERVATIAAAHVIVADKLTAHDGIPTLDPVAQATVEDVTPGHRVVLKTTDGSDLAFMVYVRDGMVFLARLEPDEGWVRVAQVHSLADLGDKLATLDLATDRF